MNQQQPNNSSIIVISPHFCNPYQVNLYIAKKVKNVTEGNKLGVFDTNGNNIFKVTGNLLSSCRMLVDAAGVPIVTLQEQIYFTQSMEAQTQKICCLVSRTKALQIKTNLDVFLASNTNEDVCDFKVKQNYSEKSCVVYRGSGSENIIAEMHKEKTEVLGKDTFSVTIHPNIDYAFIIALRVVLDEMNKAAKRGDSGVGAVSGVVVGVITA